MGTFEALPGVGLAPVERSRGPEEKEAKAATSRRGVRADTTTRGHNVLRLVRGGVGEVSGLRRCHCQRSP